MSDDSTKEELKALCEKLRTEAEEALAAMDPTRAYVPGSGYTAWENTLAGTYMSADNPYRQFFLPRADQQPPLPVYDNTAPAWIQPVFKK